MNLDKRYNVEKPQTNDINQQIEWLSRAIETEFKISKNILWELLNFKKNIIKKENVQNSIEYRKALIWEIQRLSQSWEIDSQLSNDQSIILADKVISLEKLKEKTQTWIDELRDEIINNIYNNSLFSSKWLSLKWSKDILHKIDNPQWFWDSMLWFSVGIVETWAVIWKILSESLIWILKSPFDIIELARWKAQLETNIKI